MICFCLMIGEWKAWIQLVSSHTTSVSSTPIKLGSLQRMNMKEKYCLVLHHLARKRQSIFQCCGRSHTLIVADWIAGSLVPSHQLSTRSLAISTGFIFAEKGELKITVVTLLSAVVLFYKPIFKASENEACTNNCLFTVHSVKFETGDWKIWLGPWNSLWAESTVPVSYHNRH